MEKTANKIVSLSSNPGFISELEKQQIHEYAMDYALKKEKEQGIENTKIEIAKKSLKQGIDINTISTITDLSNEEIESIQKEELLILLSDC